MHVQRVKETRPIRLAKRFAAALAKRIGGAHIGHQITGRQHIADIGLCQRLAIVFQHLRTTLDTARGKRDITGNHNIPRPRPVRDPHIGHIRSIRHHDCLNQRVQRWANTTVGYNEHLHLMAGAGAFDLGLDRTSIRIDVDHR